MAHTRRRVRGRIRLEPSHGRGGGSKEEQDDEDHGGYNDEDLGQEGLVHLLRCRVGPRGGRRKRLLRVMSITREHIGHTPITRAARQSQGFALQPACTQRGVGLTYELEAKQGRKEADARREGDAAKVGATTAGTITRAQTLLAAQDATSAHRVEATCARHASHVPGAVLVAVGGALTGEAEWTPCTRVQQHHRNTVRLRRASAAAALCGSRAAENGRPHAPRVLLCSSPPIQRNDVVLCYTCLAYGTLVVPCLHPLGSGEHASTHCQAHGERGTQARTCSPTYPIQT